MIRTQAQVASFFSHLHKSNVAAKIHVRSYFIIHHVQKDIFPAFRDPIILVNGKFKKKER